MRGRDMACAGNADISTPKLDRLAAGGLRFPNATSCIPVCTPARACLLTGRYPLSTGMFLNDPPPIRPDRYSTDWETDVALDLFDQLTGPWCLFLSWSPPHNPYHQLPATTLTQVLSMTASGDCWTDSIVGV